MAGDDDRKRIARTGLADRARAALAGDAEACRRFDELLAAARQIGPLTETHNYWIDRMAQASLRRFVLRVGRRLVDAGAVADPADVFLLKRDEVPELVRRPEDRRAPCRR